MSDNQITIKRGDTYHIDVAVTEADGTTPVDLTDWTVRSHVRRRDALIAELDFTAVDLAAGEYSLSYDDTTEWPLGRLSTDIEYTDSTGIIRSTETYIISVIRDVTYD
jgi:hypothetical protein